MSPQILIVDDHSMIRKGIKLLLQLNLGYYDIEEVASCAELMSELKKKKYTHLILDMILPDGTSLEILPNISSLYPKMNIMMFSMQPADVYSDALKKYGIRYYLSKTSPEEKTIAILKSFLADEQPAEKQVSSKHNNPFSSLSARELEILHYLLKGQGTKFISETLNLRMNTISTMKKRIFEKTNTDNLKTLTELAVLYNVSY
jgi:DNA-binding NarL/FixJ family response regulator